MEKVAFDRLNFIWEQEVSDLFRELNGEVERVTKRMREIYDKLYKEYGFPQYPPKDLWQIDLPRGGAELNFDIDEFNFYGDKFSVQWRDYDYKKHTSEIPKSYITDHDWHIVYTEEIRDKFDEYKAKKDTDAVALELHNKELRRQQWVAAQIEFGGA